MLTKISRQQAPLRREGGQPQHARLKGGAEGALCHRGGGRRQCVDGCAGTQPLPLGNPSYWAPPLDARCSEGGAVAGRFVARGGRWESVDMRLQPATQAYQQRFWGQ